MLAARTPTFRSSSSSVRCIPIPRRRVLLPQSHVISRLYSENSKPPARSSDASLTERPKVSANLDKALSIPPRVKGWPTPWLNQSSFENYMQPLYDRGWGIRFMPRLNKEPRTLGLSAGYRLKGWNQTMKFLTELNTLCRREKHHPVSFSIYNNPTHADIKLMVQTHSAVRPAGFVRDAEDTAEREALELPGPTLRDVRLAVLIHNLWEEEATAPTTDQPNLSHVEWMKMLQKLMGDPLDPNPKASSSEADKVEMAFNPNSTRGGLWTPVSMQPSWSQLACEMARCNDKPISTAYNWAIGKVDISEDASREDGKDTKKGRKRRNYFIRTTKAKKGGTL